MTDRVFKFDIIRILKIMEISQYSIISFLISLLIGKYINDLFDHYDEHKYYIKLLYELILHVFILTVATYYIRKISLAIPFILKPLIDYQKIKYIPSKKGESILGVALGISYVFMATQTNLINKITHI